MPLVSKSFSDIITFTRASSGTYFDATGTLQTATTNTARFDYNPSTLAARGMLVEEQRTNSIRNNTMQGAVAGTPGTSPTNWSRSVSPTSGISSEIVGTGTENGITYIDIRFTGTCTANVSFSVVFETESGISAAPSEAWTSSAYVKLQAGSLNGSTYQIFVNEYNSTPAFLRNTFSSTITPTTANLATQRNAFTITTGTSTAYVQPVVAPGFVNGSTYDFTLRIGMPQCEKGAFATSVISTSTAAATRSADVASVNTLSPWYNASTGTVYAEFVIPNSVPAGSFPNIWILSDGTLNNRQTLFNYQSSGNKTNFTGTVSASSQWSLDGASTIVAANTTTKTASAYQSNNIGLSVQGGSALTDGVANIPNITALYIGNANGTQDFINGYIRRITYYPRRLSNAELQSITA